MTPSMAIIAVIPSVLILVIGSYMLASWAGYSFDLRRNKTSMLGGRRLNDRSR